MPEASESIWPACAKQHKNLVLLLSLGRTCIFIRCTYSTEAYYLILSNDAAFCKPNSSMIVSHSGDWEGLLNVQKIFIVLERWRNSAGVLVEHGVLHNIPRQAVRDSLKFFLEARYYVL